MAIEILFVPAVEGLATKVGGDIMRPADDLALFYGDIDFTTARVAEYDIELRADGVL